MVFVKKTFEYLKKSFPVLLVSALIPAIVLGFLTEPFSGLTFIPLYIKSDVGGFSDVFFMMFSRRGLKLVFPYILAFAAFILSCSYSLSIMEKHFKTGKLLLHSPIRSVNNSILSVLKIVPLAVIVVLAVVLIQTGVVSLIRYMATGAGYPGVHDCIWTVIFSILAHLIIVTLTVFFGVWMIIIQIFGFSFGDAFVESIRTASKKWLSFICGILIPVTILIIPSFILNALPFELTLVKIVVNISAITMIIVYYSAYLMVSVYDLTGLERRDQKLLVPKENTPKTTR